MPTHIAVLEAYDSNLLKALEDSGIKKVVLIGTGTMRDKKDVVDLKKQGFEVEGVILRESPAADAQYGGFGKYYEACAAAKLPAVAAFKAAGGTEEDKLKGQLPRPAGESKEKVEQDLREARKAAEQSLKKGWYQSEDLPDLTKLDYVKRAMQEKYNPTSTDPVKLIICAPVDKDGMSVVQDTVLAMSTTLGSGSSITLGNVPVSSKTTADGYVNKLEGFVGKPALGPVAKM